MDQTGDMKDTTHKDVMQKASPKFDLLMNSGKWGTKSPNQKKVWPLKLNSKSLRTSNCPPNWPTSSTKIDTKDQTREKREPMQVKIKGITIIIARTTQTSDCRRRTKNGSRWHPRTMNQNTNKMERKLDIDVFTI